MTGPKRHVQIDGDTRNGALFAESASRYVGTRRIAGGKFEERVFDGVREWQAKKEWREWRDETVKRETIHIDRGKAMGAKRHSADRPIAGNTNDGRLYSTGVNGHYIGERRTSDGKLETKRFDMSRAKAKEEWRKWCGELARQQNDWCEEPASQQDSDEIQLEVNEVHESSDTDKGDGVSAKVQPTKGKQETMYILVFRASRTQKTVAAFHDMDSALRMAESLGVALDVSGAEGEFDVTDVEVWG